MNEGFGKLHFEFGTKAGARAQRAGDEGGTLRIALLGNFSGATAREGAGKARRIDCDNVEAFLAGLGATLRLKLADGTGINLQFKQIDDFHPEQLMRSAPELRTIARISDSAAAAVSPPATMGGTAVATNVGSEIMAKLLGGKPPTVAAETQRKESPADAILRKAVAGSIVPEKTTEQRAAESVASIGLADKLRMVLHHRDFRDLEAAWRALDLFVRDFGADEAIEVRVLNISRKELADPVIQKQLAEADFLSGGFVCCLHQFGATEADVTLLGTLAKIAEARDFTFLAGGASELAGCRSFEGEPSPEMWNNPLSDAVAEQWKNLRAISEARRISLAMPRILMRLPYGRGGEKIDGLDFEELPDSGEHEHYLWGSAALAGICAIASSFQENGGDLPRSISAEMTDMPVYKFSEDGETMVKPAAEAWLTEKAAQILISKGFSPVLSIKNRDAVRLALLQSIGGHTI